MAHKLTMYENLQDMVERELGEIERKGDINKENLDNLYKLAMVEKCIAKKIDMETMKEMEKNGEMSYDPYSQARGRGMRSYDSYDRMSMAMHPYSQTYSPEVANPHGMVSYDQTSADGRRGRDADNDGRYSEDGGNFRGHSNRDGISNGGRESYEYSRDASRKKMVQKLETLMDDTMSEKERMAIQECINKIQ